MTIKQTAGRDQLGEFAPDFAHFNDDILLVKTGTILTLMSKLAVLSPLLPLCHKASQTVHLCIICKMPKLTVLAKKKFQLS